MIVANLLVTAIGSAHNVGRDSQESKHQSKTDSLGLILITPLVPIKNEALFGTSEKSLVRCPR